MHGSINIVIFVLTVNYLVHVSDETYNILAQNLCYFLRQSNIFWLRVHPIFAPSTQDLRYVLYTGELQNGNTDHTIPGL